MRRNDILAGTVLMVSACLVIFAMAHHPSGHGHGQGMVNSLVHGGMLVLLLAWWFGLTWLVVRWGLPGILPLAALILFSASTVAHLISATINGFVVPALTSHGPPPPGHDIFLLCWAVNQSFATLGVYATGAAFALCALHQLSRRGWFNPVAGLAGMVAAILPIAILVEAGSRMDVPTAFAIYAIHAGWLALIGFGLVAGLATGDDHQPDAATRAERKSVASTG